MGHRALERALGPGLEGLRGWSRKGAFVARVWGERGSLQTFDTFSTILEPLAGIFFRTGSTLFSAQQHVPRSIKTLRSHYWHLEAQKLQYLRFCTIGDHKATGREGTLAKP